MEVKSVSESSISNVKLSHSGKKTMKKQRKHQSVENGNAETKEKEISLGSDSKNLESKANVSLDSRLQEGENSIGKDFDLGTEQLTCSRRKRKRKENSLIDEKQSDCFGESKVNVSLESGLKEEANSLMKETLSKRDSNVETLENVGPEYGLNEQPPYSERKRKRKKKRKEGPDSVVELRDRNENSLIDGKQSDSRLESGLKGVQLNEQPADSERKRKSKKGRKMAEAGQFVKWDQKSVVELRDEKENYLMDEKQSDSHVESKLNVSLESGLKEGASSLMKDTLLERDSHVATFENIGLESGLKESRLNENISLESGLKESQLNDQPTDSERKRKRKKGRKMAKARQFEELDAKSVLELRDRKENSLIDEKQSDSRVESEVNVSLESGLNEGANSDLQTLENISFESGLKGNRLNEQMVPSERKRKREKRKNRRFSVLEDNDISSRRNDRDNNEAENNNMCPEPRITNRKGSSKEDLMSISENVVSKNMKNVSSIPDKQSDSPQTASTTMGETQDLHVDGDLVMSDIKDIETFQIEKKVKTYHRKRKKSSDLLGGSLEHVRENGMVQTSIDLLEKERTMGFLENRSDAILVGHAMPAQVLEESFGNSTGTEATLKGRKTKKRKKLKESLCKYPDQKDVEIETKMEELIPSPSNLTTSEDDVALKAMVKENNLSRTLYSSLERICISCPKKKLLVLDLNGILVDVVQNPGEFQPDIQISGKGVFKRPFCDDFLHFCFRTFNVGIWSSRINKNVGRLVSFLMRKWRRNLLFCWHRKQCTITKFKTIEDKQKLLVLKELRKLWEKHLPNLPWEKGEYDESNTLLLDDSPYKALRNPANTAVFPYPYQYRDGNDSSLGRGGDIRKYLEGLAAAENVQKYVEQNPFGQPAITESNPDWDFYSQIIEDKT